MFVESCIILLNSIEKFHTSVHPSIRLLFIPKNRNVTTMLNVRKEVRVYIQN